MKRMQLQSGTTLVEALITVLLFTMLFGAAVAVLLSGSDSWQVNSVMAELQQERRKAVEWMKEDLLQGGYSTITNVPADGVWYTTITFNTSAGVSGGNITWSTNTVRFLLGGSGSTELQKVSGSTTKVIAEDIHTLQFRRQSTTPSVVEVSLTAQKNTLKGATLSATTTFKVKMRN